jgi:hypothetical protein
LVGLLPVLPYCARIGEVMMLEQSHIHGLLNLFQHLGFLILAEHKKPKNETLNQVQGKERSGYA